MADPIIPATPQAFNFANRDLKGKLLGFSGDSKRRFVTHQFPKRKGGKVEDMEQAPQRLTVRLMFIGPTCAADYQAFKSAVSDNPTGLLVHPIAGKFFAFCEGPNERVDFASGTDLIEVNCSWTEDELDATIEPDVPNVATAAQNASGQLAQMQQSAAGFMGAVAKAQTAASAGLNAIDAGLSQLASLTSPVDSMFEIITQAQGVQARAIALLKTVQLTTETMVSDVSSFVEAAADLFDGSDAAATGTSDSIATLLGIVQTSAAELEDALSAASTTPAGAADAVADVEIMVDYCLTLSDAVQAALPPTIKVVVPAPTNLIVFAAQLIRQFGADVDPVTYAAAILGLNRIPNPAFIEGGTELNVPSLQ